MGAQKGPAPWPRRSGSRQRRRQPAEVIKASSTKPPGGPAHERTWWHSSTGPHQIDRIKAEAKAAR